jgi:hypothetical protein
MSNISSDQVSQMNQIYGYFKYADAQGQVSRAFANEAIDRYERIRSAAPELLEVLQALIKHLEDGDEESDEIDNARAAIAKATGAAV